MRMIGLGASYVPGGGATAVASQPFAGNPLTSDPVRYARIGAIIEAEPALGLGSPTIAWARRGFRVMSEFADPAYAARSSPADPDDRGRARTSSSRLRRSSNSPCGCAPARIWSCRARAMRS